MTSAQAKLMISRVESMEVEFKADELTQFNNLELVGSVVHLIKRYSNEPRVQKRGAFYEPKR
jgi:hypothetical protein